MAFPDALAEALEKVGLAVVEMKPDGNCLFRSVSFQVFGTQGRHVELRQRSMDLVEAHASHFEPFIDEDEGLLAYCVRLREDAEWGGQLEIMALARLLRCKIAVHQHEAPSYLIDDGLPPDAPQLHLAYHDGIHYNAVRTIDDALEGGPAPQLALCNGVYRADPTRPGVAWPPAAAPPAEGAAESGKAPRKMTKKARRRMEKEAAEAKAAQEEEAVRRATGLEDMAAIREALVEAAGDAAAAAHLLECTHPELAGHGVSRKERKKAIKAARKGKVPGKAAGKAAGEAEDGDQVLLQV